MLLDTREEMNIATSSWLSWCWKYTDSTGTATGEFGFFFFIYFYCRSTGIDSAQTQCLVHNLTTRETKGSGDRLHLLSPDILFRQARYYSQASRCLDWLEWVSSWAFANWALKMCRDTTSNVHLRCMPQCCSCMAWRLRDSHRGYKKSNCDKTAAPRWMCHLFSLVFCFSSPW